jgi:hypothetical protein
MNNDSETLNLTLPCPELTLQADYVQLQKMVFLCNAIEQGWTVRKQQDRYIFVKKHENKREVYLESYLRTFLAQNMDTRIFNAVEAEEP